MTVNTAVQQLLEVEAARRGGAYGPDTLAVGMSRLGAPDQQIVAGSMQQLLSADFGAPLHCLVIAGGFCARVGASEGRVWLNGAAAAWA
jgi:diphthine synthase